MTSQPPVRDKSHKKWGKHPRPFLEVMQVPVFEPWPAHSYLGALPPQSYVYIDIEKIQPGHVPASIILITAHHQSVSDMSPPRVDQGHNNDGDHVYDMRAVSGEQDDEDVVVGK
jgi:hypothetical protein